MKKVILILVALALLPVATASADSITTSLTGNALTNDFTATFNNGSISRSYGYYAGQERFTDTTTGVVYYGWCLDFMDYSYNPQSMTFRPITEFGSGNPPNSQPGVGTQVGWLLNQFGPNDGAIKAAAIQFALWEVVLDPVLTPAGASVPHSLGTGWFKVVGSDSNATAAIGIANTLLANLGASSNALWLDMVPGVTNGQDYGVPVPVPEPASMLLLGSGLFGLAGAARRRMKK